MKIPESWRKVLQPQLEKSYFKDLIQSIENEYATTICFPPKESIFAAFSWCDFNNVKVVIVGQDPYHGDNEANGLAFSVYDNQKIPPSLANIFREIASDYNRVLLPASGNLERWAKQGVLLLNASLTVRKDEPNSHKHLQWNVFTDAVIAAISEKKESIVFLLWGNFAQKKGKKINRNQHLVLESGHPSPLSANQGKWFGNKHFSQANAFLKSHGMEEIEW
jgi:uracil-DNA glycosylase